MTMSPARGIMVCIYLYQYVSFTPHLSHPGSRDLCKPWNAPCISVYWLAHVHDLQLHALDWTARTTGATHICREDYQRRQVDECTSTWYKHISLLGQWSCSCQATCQRRRLCESKTTDELTVLLFCDVHIDKGATLNLLRCLHIICGHRDIQTNSVLRPRLRHHWHCCICSYCHNINQLRLAPSIPWMHYSYSIGFFCSVVSIDKFI